VSIISALMALLLPALSAARESARMARELSAARMLLVGYQANSSDSDGKLLKAMDNKPERRILNNHGAVVWDPGPPAYSIGGSAAHLGYPWRLAPYLNYHIDGALLVNEQAGILDSYRGPVDEVTYTYRTNYVPSLGLNARIGQAAHPFWNPNAIARQEDVRQPSDFLVAASARSNVFAEFPEGHRYVKRVATPYDPTNNDSFGNVSLRWDGRAVVAHLDGHADLREETDLATNARLWDGQ
jgi:hypothetical protein